MDSDISSISGSDSSKSSDNDDDGGMKSSEQSGGHQLHDVHGQKLLLRNSAGQILCIQRSVLDVGKVSYLVSKRIYDEHGVQGGKLAAKPWNT